MEEQETIANELAWLRAENQQMRAQLEKLTALEKICVDRRIESAMSDRGGTSQNEPLKKDEPPMAKGQFHSSHQKGIIKRYYENKEDINSQKLGEIVSELYLADSPAKAARLWKSAETALVNLGAKKERVDKIVAAKDLQALAKLVEELF